MKSIIKKLSLTQTELKAPKEQFNKFGNYAYRNCEDILEALKPILRKYELALIIEDEILLVGDRYYIKATCTLTDGLETVLTSALARESFDKKGMDDSQITGAASSYARKYALNGMFLIDDTKDADTTNTHEKGKIQQPAQQNQQEQKPSSQLATLKQIEVLKKFFPKSEIVWETLTNDQARKMFEDVNKGVKK